MSAGPFFNLVTAKPASAQSAALTLGFFSCLMSPLLSVFRLEVKIPDVAGWQVRCYHFGEEKEDHCWHSAYTNVPRITICALFRWWDKPHMKEQILAMKDQLIEDIESEI